MPALQLLDNIVPISDFNRGKASSAFSKVGEGNPVVVMKRNRPSYIIISPEDYRKAAEIEEDLALLALATERMKDFDPAKTIGEKEIMERYGITEADLDEMDEVEFE